MTTENTTRLTVKLYGKVGLVQIGGRMFAKSEVEKALAKHPPSPAAARASSAPAARFTKADLNAAAAKARTAERGKVASVFAAVASRGRERQAASLIAGNPDLSAAQICARLSTMPTDAERERMKAKAQEQAAANVWDRARERLGK